MTWEEEKGKGNGGASVQIVGRIWDENSNESNESTTVVVTIQQTDLNEIGISAPGRDTIWVQPKALQDAVRFLDENSEGKA